VQKALTLNAKGSAADGGDSVKIGIKSKKGVRAQRRHRSTAVTFKNARLRSDAGQFRTHQRGRERHASDGGIHFIVNGTIFQTSEDADLFGEGREVRQAK